MHVGNARLLTGPWAFRAPLFPLLPLLFWGCAGENPEDGLISDSAEEELAAVAEEIRAEEEAAENLVFRPLELPPADFSQAPMETEPNDEEEEATPLGTDLMVQGTFEDWDVDYFTFTTDGEPQLWTVEGSGEHLQYVEYKDISGYRDVHRSAVEGTASLTNLYLPPGRHFISTRGETGPYTLRVVSQGPPDPSAEMEPNDEESRAHVLRVGRSRLGYLAEESDQDYYRFSLKKREHLRLLVAPPPDLGIRADLYGGEGHIVHLGGGEVGDSIPYEIQLPLGDYHVRITSQSSMVSQLPYRIRLDRLDPFDPPADLEPNDGVLWARPLTTSLVIRGEVGRWGDSYDYYRLPVQAQPAGITLKQIDLPESWTLDRFVSVRNARISQLGDMVWNEADSTLTGQIPADSAGFLQVNGAGSYAFSVSMDPGPEPTPEPRAGSVDVALPPGPHILAAFWPEAQQAELPLQLRNGSEDEVAVTLEVASSDPRWQGHLPPGPVTLGPGEVRSVPLTVDVAPDAWGDYPVRITVRVLDTQGGVGKASAEMMAACGAPASNPSPHVPLPPELLGGINVAWSALGADAISDDAHEQRRETELLDGFATARDPWYTYARDLPRDLDVQLGGSDELQVAGVVLYPKGPEDRWAQIRDFELWLSSDGREYSLATSGSLTWRPEDQAFLLPSPVPARFARLRILSNQGHENYAYLGEWKVIAVPGTTSLEREGANIANPDLGGHVVWSDPLVRNPQRAAPLTEDSDVLRVMLDPVNPNEWIIGFHNDRAAQIRRLEWVQVAADSHNFIDGAHVSVSTGSPLGPWTPIGTLSVDPLPGAMAAMDLPEPVWARYVKLSVTEATEEGRWYPPETVRVFEAPTDQGYRSILGEWGRYEKMGLFERQVALEPEMDPRAEADENDTRNQAQELELELPYRGSVRVAEDLDWYRIDAPSGDNRLRFEVRGIPSLRTSVHLEDESGAEVPLTKLEEGDPGVLGVYEAEVLSGGRYFLRVEEPPRSIALVWDNSASITPFVETLYPSLLRFSRDVLPEREYVNLLPFRDSPSFLLEEWSDRSYELLAALTDYDRTDGSSDAEKNLRFSVEEMRGREGTKAVVFLTDADSPGFNESPQLWDALGAVRPNIFAVELHRGDPAHQQDLMQSWASVNAGHYDYFRTGADLDVAFQRATCLIRRPARYEVTAFSRHEEPPPPGFLAVAPGELELNAVELILDASGSMLQRMEGQRRIDIARDVLSNLVEETIPEGTPLALRIFGHKTPDACDTDLEIPIQPLDRVQVTQVIRQTEAMNLARTPIGASLALVAEDLRDVTGQKLIMLITDGEETCEGDPAAEIRRLKEEGHDIRVNIVGFAIDDEGLRAQFERWARDGGGLYFNASNRQELSDGVDRALRPKFQVLGPTGEVLAEGTAGLDPVEVPVGVYTVRVLTSPLRTVTEVRVQSEQTTTVEMPGGEPF